MLPDFSGQNLRGRNFKGQDLTEANFSHADIRGANFTNAILKGANFTGAKAGVQRRWMFAQASIAFLSAFTFFFSSVISGNSYKALQEDIGLLANVPIAYNAITVFLISFAFWIFVFRTMATKVSRAIITIATVISVVTVLAVTITYSSNAATVGALSSFLAFFGLLFFSGAGSIIVAAFLGGIVGSNIISTIVLFKLGITNTADAFTVNGVFAITLIGLYVTRRAIQKRIAGLEDHPFGVALGAMGGTSFCGANLTKASFLGATLKSTNFNPSRKRQTNLSQVCWKDAKKLDHARVGNSILADPLVRELLVTRNGYKKLYIYANFRGANLTGVNLNEANLQWADLSKATLRRATLHHVNLREVLAVGTDFSKAYLTGACLQSWNIDSTTILKDVDCQYVFLLEQANELGSRERRPHDANKMFQPGDFEKFFKEVLDTVQILIRDGINPDAFKVALQTVLEKYPNASVQGIEKQDSDLLLTLKVPAGTNKEEVEQDWDEGYQTRLEAEKNAALLEAEQQHTETLKAITLSTINNLGNFFSTLTINTTAHNIANNTAMNDSTDQSRNINVGGNVDITGSTINLGEISGTVTNTIHQLQQTDRPHTSELAALLTQLQAAINTETHLSKDDKALALEQTQSLAEAAKAPEDGTLKKSAKVAIGFFNGMVQALPATATLVEAVGKLLPSIASLLGL